MKDSVKETLRGALLALWVGVIGFVVVMGLYFFRAAETEEFITKSMFYFGFGALFTIAVVSGIAVITSLIKAGKISYEKYGWINLFIHDPEEDSILAKTHLAKYLTFWNIFHFSIIFGLALSLYSTLTGTFFVALPSTEFQVTATGKLILATEPAALMETIMMIFVIGFLYGIGKWSIYKYKLADEFRYLLIIFVPIFSAMIWVAIHYIRYGAEETNLLATGFFGLGGALISLLTGSIVTFYFWHIFNNLGQKAIELFSNELVLPIVIFALFVYVGIFIFWKIFRWKKR